MNLDYLKKFSKSEQLLMVGSEFERARIWEHKDKARFIEALWRAIEIIDLMLEDGRWSMQKSMLVYFRNEVAKRYVGEKGYEIGKLYQAL